MTHGRYRKKRKEAGEPAAERRGRAGLLDRGTRHRQGRIDKKERRLFRGFCENLFWVSASNLPRAPVPRTKRFLRGTLVRLFNDHPRVFSFGIDASPNRSYTGCLVNAAKFLSCPS